MDRVVKHSITVDDFVIYFHLQIEQTFLITTMLSYLVINSGIPVANLNIVYVLKCMSDSSSKQSINGKW